MQQGLEDKNPLVESSVERPSKVHLTIHAAENKMESNDNIIALFIGGSDYDTFQIRHLCKQKLHSLKSCSNVEDTPMQLCETGPSVFQGVDKYPVNANESIPSENSLGCQV